MKIALFVRQEDFPLIADRLDDIYRTVNSEGSIFADGESFESKVIQGTIPNQSPNVKVEALVMSNMMGRGQGEKIVRFKTCLIELFNKIGLEVDKNCVDVRTNPSIPLDKIIAENNNTSDSKAPSAGVPDEFDYEEKAKQYVPVDPLYSFERVILPVDVLEKINDALGILECENKVFKEWGLYEIQPHPSSSLSFYGAPGTGKTMAAEAIAHKLGKKILKVSYADVESKYHGEGPKMVKAIFLAAAKADAVLFFDEADSLLSKRLTSVTQGSEQAINSMRSQLLICIEEFRGIVIFATNLVVNYDQAFLTRLISIEFKKPDVETRELIWSVHTKAPNDGKEHQLNIPLADNVDISILAEKYEFVGREIRNAVVNACVTAALNHREIVLQEDFVKACEKIVKEQIDLANAKDHTKNPTDDLLKKAIMEKIKKKDTEGCQEPTEANQEIKTKLKEGE